MDTSAGDLLHQQLLKVAKQKAELVGVVEKKTRKAVQDKMSLRRRQVAQLLKGTTPEEKAFAEQAKKLAAQLKVETKRAEAEALSKLPRETQRKINPGLRETELERLIRKNPGVITAEIEQLLEEAGEHEMALETIKDVLPEIVNSDYPGVVQHSSRMPSLMEEIWWAVENWDNLNPNQRREAQKDFANAVATADELQRNTAVADLYENL